PSTRKRARRRCISSCSTIPSRPAQSSAEKEEPMEYRRFGDKIVARLDKGEEICSTLLDLAGREGIRLASVSGIGASNDITLGVFRTKKKEYVQHRYYGIDYELASVTGNLSMKDGQPYLHLHAVIGNPSLKSAYLSLDEREPGI